MLIKSNQSQKATYCILGLHLCTFSRISKTRKTKSRLAVSSWGDSRVEDEWQLLMDTELFGGMTKMP